MAKNHINVVIDREINGHGTRLPFLDMDDEVHEKDAIQTTNIHTFHPSVHRGVGGLFSVVTALCVALVVLFLVEIIDWFSVNASLFQMTIQCLTFLVTMVQPVLVVTLYVYLDLLQKTNQGTSGSSTGMTIARVAATTILCFGWYYALHKFGDLAAPLGDFSEKSFLERKTNELVLAGITVTAVLSGVGCTATPVREWQNQNLPTSATSLSRISELILSYNATKLLIRRRQKELDALITVPGRVYNEPEPDRVRLLKGSGKRILNRVSSFASLAGAGSEEVELRNELASLHQLAESIYSDISTNINAYLRTHRQRGPSQTVKSILHWCNVAFLVYCIYRIVNVLFLRLPYHIWWSEDDLHDLTSNVIDDKSMSDHLGDKTKDALAITISKVIETVTGVAASSLVNQVSFILSGSLFLCLFQNVVVTFKSVGRILPATTTSVSEDVKLWLLNLLVSQALAIYVIATALLIRSNLPQGTVSLMLRILSLSPSVTPSSLRREVDFIDQWFDKVFAVTCVATFLVLLSKKFIDADLQYDEEAATDMV